MDKAALVNRFVAAQGFGEEARPWLEQLSDEQLGKFAALCCGDKPADEPKANEDEPEPTKTENPPPPTDAPGPTANVAPPKPQNEDEWLKLAPTPETREMYAEMRARWDAEVVQLKKDIIANSRGVFTEGDLAGKPRKELEKLAQAVRPRDYSGQGIAAHDSAAKKERKVAPMQGVKIGSAA